MNSKIDINVCYRIIFEALASGKGMQAMTEALFEYTKWPIHVVDISFNVLAAQVNHFTVTAGKKLAVFWCARHGRFLDRTGLITHFYTRLKPIEMKNTGNIAEPCRKHFLNFIFIF